MGRWRVSEAPRGNERRLPLACGVADEVHAHPSGDHRDDYEHRRLVRVSAQDRCGDDGDNPEDAISDHGCSTLIHLTHSLPAVCRGGSQTAPTKLLSLYSAIPPRHESDPLNGGPNLSPLPAIVPQPSISDPPGRTRSRLPMRSNCDALLIDRAC